MSKTPYPRELWAARDGDNGLCIFDADPDFSEEDDMFVDGLHGEKFIRVDDALLPNLKKRHKRRVRMMPFGGMVKRKVATAETIQ